MTPVGRSRSTESGVHPWVKIINTAVSFVTALLGLNQHYLGNNCG